LSEKKININNIFLFILLSLSIFPIRNIGSYEVPILYFLIPLQGVIIFFSSLGVISRPKIINNLSIFFIIISLEIILSALISTLLRLNTFVFPSDILQYIAKFFMLIFMAIWFYNRKING